MVTGCAVLRAPRISHTNDYVSLKDALIAVALTAFAFEREKRLNAALGRAGSILYLGASRILDGGMPLHPSLQNVLA
jgi:hypothetical protein